MSKQSKALGEIMEVINNDSFSRLIISSPRVASNIYKKVIAVPVIIKGRRLLQFSFYAMDKVVHHNLDGADISCKLVEIYALGYKQWEIDCGPLSFKLLVGKKGNFKKIVDPKNIDTTVSYAHNRSKNHILKDGEPQEVLIKLGLMSKDGKVFADKQRKFRQINKFLEIVQSIEVHIKKDAHILDFGCGKSYLSFALYHYFNLVLDKNVKITGLDLKKDVIEHCRTLAADCGYENLSFSHGDVKDFEGTFATDMIISLHACDTATDFALAYAVKSGAKVILSVPCCQHELFSQVNNERLNPILKHGALKEKFASLLTDAMRGQLLEALGYNVRLMEFVSAQDTAKNIMLRAVKTKEIVDYRKLKEYYALARDFSAEPALYGLLGDFFPSRQENDS